MADIYVDPSIDANTGTGTIGDPYGDLQYAITSTTQGTSGDQFNIKAEASGGGIEVITGSLTFGGSYSTPSKARPCVFRGYSSTKNDGGKFAIDCNGGNLIGASINDFLHFIDGRIFNGGSEMISLDFECSLQNVEIHNATGTGVRLTNGSYMHGCEVYDCVTGVFIGSGFLYGNYFRNGTVRDSTYAIDNNLTDNCKIFRNIISIDGTSIGIRITKDSNFVISNSILSAGGSGTGIELRNFAEVNHVILNNVVEGFSTGSGVGIFVGSSNTIAHYGGNAVFNCVTPYSGSPNIIRDSGDNETLSATPFAKSGSDTFANRFVYFAPVDTGNVHGGAVQ